MTTLVRWDPFRQMNVLRSELDRYFDEPFLRTPSLWQREGVAFSLALDVAEDDQGYLVKASLPGVAPEDIEITLDENALTISGKMSQDEESEGKNYHLRERRFGSFARSITLPSTVDADKVEAVNENGVLTLHLPKVEEAKPKKIAVKKMVNGEG